MQDKLVTITIKPDPCLSWGIQKGIELNFASIAYLHNTELISNGETFRIKHISLVKLTLELMEFDWNLFKFTIESN